MIGRGILSLLGAAILLGIGAPAALSDEGQRMVMVTGSPAAIEALEGNGYDVGFVGELTEAGVYVDDASEARLRAEGYTIGTTVEDASTRLAVKAQIAETTVGEALAAEVATNGLTKSAKSKGAASVPGNIVIQRAYTFSNYAGRFLYVEAHNKLHGDTTGPTMSFTYTSPNGTSQVYNLSTSTVSPDGGDAAIGGNKVADGDAGAGARYMYHRGLVALRDADATLKASDVSVRVADALGNVDSSGVTEWAGKGLPPRVAGFQKDFITKYMDPTETYNRMDSLATQFPDIMQAIDLPNKTNGYGRPAMAMMVGNLAGNGAPSAAQSPQAVYLMSDARGDLGGNNITAEFKAPTAGTLNAPLSITVTDGTWRTHDPEDTNAADGIAETTFATKDIVVNLSTDAAGALNTTAAQLVAALNADPAAGPLVNASLYAGNAGAGIVPATVARTYQVVEGTTGGPSYSSTKVRLSDYQRGGSVYWAGSFTATPPTLVRTDSRYVVRGPFQQKVYRIGKDRTNSAVGVYLYCQQHAREWVTGITCLETAERLVRNYATDPTTKEYVDKLNVFILPSSNPDGGHAAFHDSSVQRKNLTNYCPSTGASGYVNGRNSWGVDLNRNNTVGTLFDGFAGASTTCTNETFTGPFEASEPEIRNEHWIPDTFKGIKFANNIHTHGGYFMWAPGAYKSAGRVTLPAPNIGVERYFFDVADTILSHIRSSRNTAILPQRVGPIADVLYSAAGNSADEQYYNRGIIAYSFEAGAQRIAINPTTGAITRTAVGFQPCFAGPGTNGGQGSTCGTVAAPNALLVNEGHDSTMEFAEGNFGEIQAALEYHNDVTAPVTAIEYSSAQTSGEPINFKFNWVGEPSVIYYTTDGTAPQKVADCAAPTGASKCYNGQGPRRPGEVLTLGTPGAYTVKWFSEDLKGNREAVKTQRLLVAADDESGTPGGTVPATLALTIGQPAAFAPFTPGVPRDYTAGTTANVISTAGSATLSVADPSSVNTGHLMNGTFFLPQKLQASASSLGGTAASGGAVGGSSAPTSLLNYAGPVSNDAVTLTFKQTIGATDALRTGSYSKSLTFTLSTTQP
jgi:hypothetical protein